MCAQPELRVVGFLIRHLNDCGLLEILPEKRASGMYVKSMEQTYCMTEIEKRDAGFIAVLEGTPGGFTRAALLTGSIVCTLRTLFRDMPAPGNIVPA
jgi:hypothetical protein